MVVVKSVVSIILVYEKPEADLLLRPPRIQRRISSSHETDLPCLLLRWSVEIGVFFLHDGFLVLRTEGYSLQSNVAQVWRPRPDI